MGRAVSLPQRHLIFQRMQQGHRTDAVAADLGLSTETVRALIRRFRRHGAAAITPAYAHCGSHQTKQADPDLIALAMQL